MNGSVETFYWGVHMGDFLFKGLKIESSGPLVGACFCVASIAFVFEFLRYLQAKHRQKELKLKSMQLKTICPVDTDSAALLSGARTMPNNPVNITALDKSLLYGADFGLWFILFNLGYLLMLTIMAYNSWIFLSAILGGGLGYFVFGQKFMKLNLQNCHIIRETFCMQNCQEPGGSESSTSLLRQSNEGEGSGDHCRNDSKQVDDVDVTVHQSDCH